MDIPTTVPKGPDMNFYESIIKRKIVQICDHVGYTGTTIDSLNILTDLYGKIMYDIGLACKETANRNRRSEVTMIDFQHAFEIINMSMIELKEHIDEVGNLKFPIKVEEHDPEPSNRVQRNLLVDELLEEEKREGCDNDLKTPSENGEEEEKPTVEKPPPLLKDSFIEVVQQFPDCQPVSADKTLRVAKIKITSPLPPQFEAPLPPAPKPTASPKVRVKTKPKVTKKTKERKKNKKTPRLVKVEPQEPVVIDYAPTTSESPIPPLERPVKLAKIKISSPLPPPAPSPVPAPLPVFIPPAPTPSPPAKLPSPKLKIQSSPKPKASSSKLKIKSRTKPINKSKDQHKKLKKSSSLIKQEPETTPEPPPEEIIKPEPQPVSDDATFWDPCPKCNQHDDGSLMIQCDDPLCARWFHGKCVGVLEEPVEDIAWFCDACVERQQSAFGSRRRRPK